MQQWRSTLGITQRYLVKISRVPIIAGHVNEGPAQLSETVLESCFGGRRRTGCVCGASAVRGSGPDQNSGCGNSSAAISTRTFYSRRDPNLWLRARRLSRKQSTPMPALPDGATARSDDSRRSQRGRTIINEELRPALLGQDPFFSKKLRADLWKTTEYHGVQGVAQFAMAVDIALWD